jgi:hypothetical protein
MKSIITIVALLCLLPISSYCEELRTVENKELAFALGASTVLLDNSNDNNTPFHFKVITVPVAIDECWGTIESCPDQKLYITVSTGDLNDTPSLYQLPVAKNWDVVESLGSRVIKGQRQIGIKIKTMLPTANIKIEERQKWRPTTYKVWLSEYAAVVETE